MGKDYFEFSATQTYILLVNNKPVIRNTDDGIWRRLRLVPFDQKFEGDNRDLDLKQQLEMEMEGILAWMVEGAISAYQDGLREPATERMPVKNAVKSLIALVPSLTNVAFRTSTRKPRAADCIKPTSNGVLKMENMPTTTANSPPSYSAKDLAKERTDTSFSVVLACREKSIREKKWRKWRVFYKSQKKRKLLAESQNCLQILQILQIQPQLANNEPIPPCVY